MKKKLVRGFIALALVIGTGVAVTMTSDDAHACTNCNVNNTNRKCKCGSSRLFADKIWTASNGKQRTKWICKDCGHKFITELRKGKEVILSDNEN